MLRSIAVRRLAFASAVFFGSFLLSWTKHLLVRTEVSRQLINRGDVLWTTLLDVIVWCEEDK